MNKSDFTNEKSCSVHMTVFEMFYIIYANDFSRASELLFTIMFADDTSVFIEGQSYGNVCQLLNEELEKCDNWIKANKLSLNLKNKHIS